MSKFLIVFFSVYTLMNALVFFKVKMLLPPRWIFLQWPLGAFVCVMIFAPIGAHLLEVWDHESMARAVAYTGYVWMGFAFLSLWGFFLLASVDVFLKLFSFLAKSTAFSLSGKVPIYAVFGFVVLVCIYGCFEAQWIRTEYVTVWSAKLPEGLPRLKIAQISDVHLGLIMGEGRLNTIIEKVRTENPDLLVCTGDLVDGRIETNDGMVQLLGSIPAKYGRYAVTGNHEVYAGLSQALAVLKGAGFKVLRGAAVEVEEKLNIVGVDDPAAGPTTDEAALLSSVQNGRFTLFLKHRPQVLETSAGLFDLQLSGHTHRGQIFPFRFFTAMVYPMQDGLYDLNKGSKLYTSRGSGTWGPPMRVLSPPEVTIIEVIRERPTIP